MAGEGDHLEGMRRLLKDNGLSLTMLGLFLLFWVGHSLTGWKQNNQERTQHGLTSEGYGAYLHSGEFLESTFENWESEFLQMAMFVVLAGKLKQKGAADSKKRDGTDEVDQDPRTHVRPDSPWPVRRGGWVLALYSHSLSLTLFALFLFSFVMHAVHGTRMYNEEQLRHGSQAIPVLGFLGTPTFWFQAFQNWQSEFLSVGALVLLSIFLREKGSPESKPVHVPSRETEGA